MGNIGFGVPFILPLQTKLRWEEGERSGRLNRFSSVSPWIVLDIWLGAWPPDFTKQDHPKAGGFQTTENGNPGWLGELMRNSPSEKPTRVLTIQIKIPDWDSHFLSELFKAFGCIVQMSFL